MLALDLLRLFVPIAIGFLAGWLCPVKDAGAAIPARPPPYVFGIAWAILYILIGIAWVYASRTNRMYDIAFPALVIVLAAWSYTYGCRSNERGALYVLLLSLLITLMILVSMTVDGNRFGLCLVPLVVWLIFAGMMNYTIVNETS